MTMYALYNGTSYSVYATWSSSNTSAVSATTSPLSGYLGLISGDAPGTSTVTGSFFGQEAQFYWCGYNPSCSTVPYGSLTAQAQVTVTPCPTGIQIASSTPIYLAEFPGYLTGIGLATSMQVQPNTDNFRNTVVSESVALVSGQGPQCPTNIFGVSPGGGVWQVGVTIASILDDNWPPLDNNSFYDLHYNYDQRNLLALASLQSCQLTYHQIYSCNGQSIGEFTIIHSFSAGMLNGEAVTNVSITKIPGLQ